jgi:hypothetical protein
MGLKLVRIKEGSKTMNRIAVVVLVLALFCLPVNGGASIDERETVRDALQNTKIIAYPDNGRPVDQTVAIELKETLAPHAKIVSALDASGLPSKGVIRIAIADENFVKGPDKVSGDRAWMFFRISSSGDGELVTSKPHLLYALLCQIKDEWSDQEAAQFEHGKLLYARFSWLRGEDGFYGTKKRFTRDYNPESAIRELARMGCSGVVVNALAIPFSLETGPPGEVYYRFYVGAPDLDQFVETDLNKGSYPPEYLEANFTFLKRQAQLAVKYGLTPGLYICNPRSVPESLIQKYPFLRGARVDHPFRSYRPRFTLTLGHPAVRWHYTEMLKKILQEIPEIGFINTFLNDSGSGFEFTSRLYAGRNGGAYVAREWMPHEEFEQAAAKNIVRYYRLLRDVAQGINPDFRLIAGLFAIPEEQSLVLEGMDNGIDLQMSLADKKNPEKWKRELALLQRGSYLFTGTSAKGSLVLGTPAPWLTHERLHTLIKEELDKATVTVDPPSLAPWDVNREVLKAYQLGQLDSVDDFIDKIAVTWVGQKYASNLVDIWRACDEAVRNIPDVPLYGTSWAFEMYRLWIRPFVPDIDKIPESERDYYEKFIISIFNNPHRVDLAADVLWKLISIEQGDEIVRKYDAEVWPPLKRAIAAIENTVDEISSGEPAREIFVDLRDRLYGASCYFRTLRNVGAWVAGVHGYLDATGEAEKQLRLRMVREMMSDELQNARDLLQLWRSTEISFIPIHASGETWHEYGDNLGKLIVKKIALMEKHKDDLPYIDPNYMWRMPPEFKSLEEKYLSEE